MLPTVVEKFCPLHDDSILEYPTDTSDSWSPEFIATKLDSNKEDILVSFTDSLTYGETTNVMDIDHNDNNNDITLDETLELLCVKPNAGIDVISTPNEKVTISTPNKKGIKVKEVTKGKLTTVCPSNFTLTTVYLTILR